MNQAAPSVVIDAGTLNCKAGLANVDCPQYCFSLNQNRTNDQISPILDGVIKLWDQYEILLHHIFLDKLKISSKEYPCFITEVPNNPKINKERLIQMIFEKFDSKLFYLQQQSLLSLISQGKQTGVDLDSGEGLTYIVPVFETGIGYEEQNIVQYIKQKLSYVVLNYFEELEKQEEEFSQPYQLPDGTIINVSSQRFRCPEILFKPHLLGFDIQGIHQQTYQSIMCCDQEIRQNLFQNIVLSGGNTLFHGIEERLKKEIGLMSNEQVSINASPQRQYAVWIGGSILASLTSFDQQWITKQEYNDIGPQVIHRKCI